MKRGRNASQHAKTYPISKASRGHPLVQHPSPPLNRRHPHHAESLCLGVVTRSQAILASRHDRVTPMWNPLNLRGLPVFLSFFHTLWKRLKQSIPVTDAHRERFLSSNFPAR